MATQTIPPENISVLPKDVCVHWVRVFPTAPARTQMRVRTLLTISRKTINRTGSRYVW